MENTGFQRLGTWWGRDPAQEPEGRLSVFFNDSGSATERNLTLRFDLAGPFAEDRREVDAIIGGLVDSIGTAADLTAHKDAHLAIRRVFEGHGLKRLLH